MPRIYAPRAVTLSSTWGAAYSLAAGETGDVPECFAPLAYQAGCTPVGDTPAAPIPPAPTLPEVQLDTKTPDRSAQIAMAVRTLVAEGRPGAFTASGQPKVSAVRAEVGFDVTSAEVVAAFETVLADPETDGNDA